ncbi:MAG: ATP-binding cassette domain-containing protein [Deltaproteobacteria bacterium]|nr:ATP-binding cassette domain-containing protein [Deltaproteobacteria bacterium]
MAEAAVETREIAKRFGELWAVDRVTIRVDTGEFFGFLGPNGAGKSTLIRMLTTLHRPTSGTASVAGWDVVREPASVRRAIGVVPQNLSSDLDLTARENIDIYGKFYDVPRKARRDRTAALLERVGLTAKADDLVATYSGGMRRRLDIARALIHRPSVLFLDEPTSGLDPQSRRVVWEMLQGLMAEDGLTIFLTTHYMEEAETLCSRVAIIDHGSVIALGTPDELKRALPGNDTVGLTVGGSEEAALEAVQAEPYVRKAARDGRSLKCYVDNGAEGAPLLLQLLDRLGITVESVAIHRLSLEDVFIHHTGRDLREEESKKVSLLIGAGVPRRMGG